MLLRERATDPELFDRPGLTPEEVASNYRQLGRINRWLLYADPYSRLLPKWLGPERCRSLTVLDLGGGDGSLGRALERMAQRRGWRWEVTCLDLNPLALALNPGGRNVAGNVLALPFRDASFDVVIASQMTHHLDTADQVVQHFAEAWRVTRDAIYLSDGHRNAALYAILWCWLHLGRFSPAFIQDGLLSVRRSWRVPEWRALARQAGIPNARVWLYYGGRLILRARKQSR